MRGSLGFTKDFELWTQKQIDQEQNHRRKEILQKNSLRHGTMELLRWVWYPAVGNFDHLYPEWEVRDANHQCRYLDLAFLPGGVKIDFKIQDYRSHARDVDMRRFKDLCRRQSLLSLDDWIFLPIAYLSESFFRSKQITSCMRWKPRRLDLREGGSGLSRRASLRHICGLQIAMLVNCCTDGSNANS